jgi:hypothetical protein
MSVPSPFSAGLSWLVLDNFYPVIREVSFSSVYASDIYLRYALVVINLTVRCLVLNPSN